MEMREIADALMGPAASAGLRLRKGVVSAVTGTTVSVKIGGDADAVDAVSCLVSYTPRAVNDVVQIIQNGPALLILGRIG